MTGKKNIFLWVLYDFANSIVNVVFFLYFAQWIVVDQGASDFAYNLTFTISSALLLLTAPFVGFLLDDFWRRLPGLRYSTIASAVLYALCAGFALADQPWSALVFFTLALYAYQMSFTFYTPLLNDLANSGKRGFVSGLGISANYLGQIAGLAIALPFAGGTWSLFGGNPRAETLLPAVIGFFLLSLPMLLFFSEPRKAQRIISIGMEWKNFLKETKTMWLYPGVGLFLVSFFLFNDAILTVVNNFSIFLEQVWHVSDTTKTYLLLGVIAMSAIGGITSGILADRFGHKRTLVLILIGWMIILPSLALVGNFTWFVVATILVGFWYGSGWTVSRSVMAYLAPHGRHNLAFAYFNLAERVSSLLGPVVWGLVVSNLINLGSTRYRIAVLAVTGFILLGLVALARVRDDRVILKHG